MTPPAALLVLVSTPAFRRTLVAAALPPPRSHYAAPPKFRTTSNLLLPAVQHIYAIYQLLCESLIVRSRSCPGTAYRDDDIDHILSAKIMRKLPTDRPIDVPALR